MILSKCLTCGKKKSRFIKNQEAKGLLSNLSLRTSLSKVQIWGNILFWSATLLSCKKMNEIVKTLLLAGDKFMPEMHLKLSGLFIVLVDHLQKSKKELKNSKTKTKLIRLVFSMTWLMEILKIEQEEQLLIKF